MASRARVFAGFRRLNRARKQIFRGDEHAMKESRAQLRGQIEANAHKPTSGPVFDELVNGMDEATHMLKHEIIRGDLNEQTGRYGTFLVAGWIKECYTMFPLYVSSYVRSYVFNLNVRVFSSKIQMCVYS